MNIIFLVLLAKVYVDVELCEGARSEAGTKPNGIIITRLEAIFYKLARPLRPISPTLTRDFILFYSYYYLFIYFMYCILASTLSILT